MSNNPRSLSQDQIQELANKCKTRSEFRKRFCGAYCQAARRGILQTVCAHMVRHGKPDGYWTVERVRDAALKFESRTEFHEKESSAYNKAQRLGILDDVCSHMKIRLMHKRKRHADADALIDTINRALNTSQRNRATAYKFTNAPSREHDLPCHGSDWVLQLYDQLAYENESRALNYIEILRDRGDHDAVDAAWHLFIKHMDGNWCTAAG